MNISARANVQTGENVLIAGVLASGTETKRVIIRALGPSLGGFGVCLADPMLELHQRVNNVDTMIALSHDWKLEGQQAELQSMGLAPKGDREAAIAITLVPGQSYTAVVRGEHDLTGMALLEIYDVQPGSHSQLYNMSSRGLVGVGDDVMIAGLIVGNGTGTGKFLIRALGPSLAAFGVANTLWDPTLTLVDSNGITILANNNWKDAQQADIEASGLAPGSDVESALIKDLAPGNYTAIVSGNNNATGVALVEVYNLQ
jgi:hypothetical protein